MEDIVLEEKKYLWLNFSEQTGQHLYCYLDRDGKKIYGNTVTNSSKDSLILRLLYIRKLNVKVKRLILYLHLKWNH